MNWLRNFVRPKLQKTAIKDIADDLWCKCPDCGQMLFSKELKKSNYVCTRCGYHLRLFVDNRLRMLFDNGNFDEISLPETQDDPLKFRDSRKYTDRLKVARKNCNRRDAIVVAQGEIGGVVAIVAVMDFQFMAGSMGRTVGEGIVKAADLAIKGKCPLVTVVCSGGARMQEGMLSLMQMARTTAAVNLVKEAGIPYVSILTDPTTGGVTASFAMLGDVHIAEKGAQIAFAGKRVIEQTIRQKLPDDFQTAEYLKEHGMVDIVVTRDEMKDELVKVISILTHRKPNLNRLAIDNK